MKNKRLTSLAVLLMSVIIMLGTFCLPASAATSISKAKVTYETNYTYTGKEIKPKITVKVGSKKLTTKSYSVSYKDNKAVGKGYIVIKGKGSYSGTLKKGFYIQPKAVSSFKATAYSTKIKLTWSKATGAKGYQIYQFNNDSGKWVKLPTTSKTSCTVTDLDSATEYKFRVRPYAKVGSKSLYGEWKTVTKSTTVGKPTEFSVSDVTDSSATVKWNKVPGATSYIVYYTVASNGYSKTVDTTTESVTLTKLNTGSAYKINVSALNTAMKITGSKSDTFTFTTSPAAVKITKAEVTSEGFVNLAWSKVTGANGYTVYASKVGTDGKPASFAEAGTVTTTTVSLTGLAPSTTYIFKVCAFINGASGKAYSAETLTPPLTTPADNYMPKVQNFTNTEVTTSSATFTWTRPQNIDGYKLYKNGELTETLEAKNTSYTFTNLNEGESYKFSINTYRKELNGSISESEKVTLNVTTKSSVSSDTAVTSVICSKPSSALRPNQTFNITVTVLPSTATNKAVTFESSDSAVATVSQSGVITAKADGTATITVRSQANPDKYASFTVEVRQSDVKATSISLDPEYTMYEGELISLNPKFTPADTTNKAYTISASDYSYSYKGGLFGGNKTDTCKFDSYISISTNNLLKAKKATITPHTNEAFYFTVTVKTADGSNKTATTRVKVLAKMIDVQYKGSDVPWYYGNSAKLTVTLDDSIASKYSASDIRFTSSDTSIATVSNDGTVTCKGMGDVTITAYTSDNRYSGKYELYSRSTVSVSKNFFSSCKVGEVYQINASVLPANSTDTISYNTSDSSVATVTNTGKVTIHSPGDVMIRITCSSDPYSYKPVWFTSDSYTAPSGSTAVLLNEMKAKANTLKTLRNLPSLTRYDETITSNFSTTSKDLSASDLQGIFSSELSPKYSYLAPVASTANDYSVLKDKFINNIPVKGQSYVISSALTDSDVSNIKVIDNGEYFYEMKLLLKEETMPSLPATASSTRHGKVFDVLTSDYINTYLSKINDTGKISIKYNSFSQRYYNSTLTLKVNKATGNIESAVFDMTVDVDVRNLEMKYSLITSSMDVSFTCRNVVTLELGSYTN